MQELQAARRSAQEQPPGSSAEGQHLRQRVRELQEEMAFKDEELAQARRHRERIQGRLQTLEAEAAQKFPATEIPTKTGVVLDPRQPLNCIRPFAAASQVPLLGGGALLGSLAFFLEREHEGGGGRGVRARTPAPSPSPAGVCYSVCSLARGELDAPEAAAHIFGLLLGRAEALKVAEQDGGSPPETEGLQVLQHALPVLARLLESDRRVRDGLALVLLGPLRSSPGLSRVRFRGQPFGGALNNLHREASLSGGGEKTSNLDALSRLLAERPGSPGVRSGVLQCLRMVLATRPQGEEVSEDNFARHLSSGLADALRLRSKDPEAAHEAALILFQIAQHPGLLGALLGSPALAELARCLLRPEDRGGLALQRDALRVFDQVLRTCLYGARPDDLLALLFLGRAHGCETEGGGLAQRLVQAADQNLQWGRGSEVSNDDGDATAALREMLQLLRDLVEGPQSATLAVEDLLGAAGSTRQALWTLSNVLFGDGRMDFIADDGDREGAVVCAARVQRRLAEALRDVGPE